jgi:hypothetical protein
MTFPIAFFFKIFGVSEISAAMFPLLCSIGSIILVFYFGKLLFNERTGLMSAFLSSIFPLDVVMSTAIFPDGPLVFFMGLSVYSFLRGEKSEKRIHSYFWFSLSGLVLAIAYLVKEVALILVLFFPVYMICKRELKKSHIFVILGFLFVFSYILLYYQWVIGDFLFPFKTVSVQLVGEAKRFGLTTDFWFYPRLFFIPNEWFGFFYIFISIALGYSLIKRLKNTYPLIVWFTVLFLYLEFGIISTAPITVIYKIERYLTLLTVPSILILANLLNQKRLSTRKISLLVITFLLISSVIFVNYSTWRKSDYDLEEAILYLKTLPEKNIWASIVTALHIRFQYQYQRDQFIKSFSNLEDLTGIHDSYVVVSYGMDGDVKLPKESANWKLIKVVENPYSASRYNTTIYYVGGFYAENLGPPPPTGKWRVGDFVVFSGFLFENSTPVEGVTVTAKFSFDRASWTNIGTSVTALDGIWEVRVDAIPKEWAGRTVYFRAEANEDQSSIVSLFVNMEK